MNSTRGVERRWAGVFCASAALAFGSGAGAAVGGATFEIMPYTGGPFNNLQGVSADGLIAAGGTGGFGDYDPMFGTRGDVVTTLIPRYPGNTSSDALGISGDGQVVIGRSGLGGSSTRAARWVRQPDGSWTGEVLNDENGDPTGDLPGKSISSTPRAASQDGSVIVGVGSSVNGGEAWRWTAATGMVGLGDLPGAWFQSDAGGVSRDGTRIVGTGVSASINPDGSTREGPEAFMWTQAEGMVGLGFVAGPQFQGSGARSISGDGEVVVGYADVPAQPGQVAGRIAASWTESGGWVDLGNLPEADGGDRSVYRYGIAEVASYDGSVIAGKSGLATRSSAPFVWSEASGMRLLKAVLEEAGVSAVADWELTSITGLSDDGRTVVGNAKNEDNAFTGFFATLPEAFLGGVGITGDYNGSGQVEQGDLDLVLQNWGDDTAVTGLPVAWVNDDDNIGQIEQTELDRLLINWGSTSAPGFALNPNVVPEPVGVMALAALAVLVRRRDAT